MRALCGQGYSASETYPFDGVLLRSTHGILVPGAAAERILLTSIAIDSTRGFSDARTTVVDETGRLLSNLDAGEWDSAGELITQAGTIFVIGNGRSGLAAQMAAMRLMHLGLKVHVAGEVTAPAVTAGDVVVSVSGSGSTTTVVTAAKTAIKVGASVVAVTTAPSSALAKLATRLLIVPAADKYDHGNAITAQYAGSLFEQTVLLAFDALFHSLWSKTSITAENLWKRHANIG